MSRLSARGDAREIYEKEAMLRSVYEGYERLVSTGEVANLVVVDGEVSIDQVFTQVRDAVEKLLAS